MKYDGREKLIAHVSSAGARKTGRCNIILLEDFVDEDPRLVFEVEKAGTEEKNEKAPGNQV